MYIHIFQKDSTRPKCSIKSIWCVKEFVRDTVLKKIDMRTILKEVHHVMCICHMME